MYFSESVALYVSYLNWCSRMKQQLCTDSLSDMHSVYGDGTLSPKFGRLESCLYYATRAENVAQRLSNACVKFLRFVLNLSLQGEVFLLRERLLFKGKVLLVRECVVLDPYKRPQKERCQTRRHQKEPNPPQSHQIYLQQWHWAQGLHPICPVELKKWNPQLRTVFLDLCWLVDIWYLQRGLRSQGWLLYL